MLNIVHLIGRVGNTPEKSFLSDETIAANFSLVTTENYTDKTTGEKKEKTEWHNVCCYKGLAEIAAKFVTKGSLVYIEGKISSKKTIDRNGAEKKHFFIIASSVKILYCAKPKEKIE